MTLSLDHWSTSKFQIGIHKHVRIQSFCNASQIDQDGTVICNVANQL